MPRLLPNGNITAISHVDNEACGIRAGILVEVEPTDPNYALYIDWLPEGDMERARNLFESSHAIVAGG